MGSGSRQCVAGTTGIALGRAVLLACCALVGCAQAPVQQVLQPVAVPCLESLPAEPETVPDSVLHRLSDPDFVLELAAQRLQWRAHARELRAVALACLRR